MGNTQALEGQRLAWNMPEVAILLGISRNRAYELARAGEIPSLRLGGRVVVSKLALEQWLADATRAIRSTSAPVRRSPRPSRPIPRNRSESNGH